jgi:glutathione S-transferase
MTLKLFYSPSACSLATHIVLEEAGADYELVLASTRDGSVRKPEYLAINPKGRVPALQTDRGVLTETPAILGWVAQAYPDAKLAPAGDDFAFAQMQAFNTFLASSMHIMFALHWRTYRFVEGDEHLAAVKAHAPKALAEQFQLVEDRLQDGRAWVHGEAYTTSDPYLLVFTRWLDETGLGALDDYPHVKAHKARAEARPAVKRALEQEGLS